MPGHRRYRMVVESRLPLCPREEPRPSWPEDFSEEEGHGGCVGLNASGPLEFPIESALGARLLTTGWLALPVEPSRCSRDLGIDSLALVWWDDREEPQRAGCRERLRPDSCEFPDAELLHEASADVAAWPSSPSAPLWLPARGSSAIGGASAAPRRAIRHAFVFDAPRGGASPGGSSDIRLGEAEIALTPLDALYLARLCALDHAFQHPYAPDADGTACPPHMLASDEVLAALLHAEQDADVPQFASVVAMPQQVERAG